MINTNYRICGSLVLYGQNFNWDMTPITEVAEQLKHIVAQKQSFQYVEDWMFGDYAPRHACIRFYILPHPQQQFSISGADTLIDLLSYCGLWQIRELSASRCYDLLGRGWVSDNILPNCLELCGFEHWQDLFHNIIKPVYTCYDRFDTKEKFITFMHVYKLPGIMLLYRNLKRIGNVHNAIQTDDYKDRPAPKHELQVWVDQECLLYGVVLRHSDL